uniref:Cell death-inducing p53-target protein 1 homolog n=1 Tax=Poecilia latipinna TaxID=48699 RepID=A0A3B3TST4_9TELE
MEKGKGPPPDTEGTLEIPDIPAPPYPGPPLDPSVLTSQPNPVDHPAAENDNQLVSKSVHQEHSQQQPHSSTQHVLLVQHMPTDVAGSMLCPHCKNTVVTSIEYKVGMLTWIIFGVLLLFCWPCSCIPFCVNSCKDVQHSCPQCNNVLHLYKRR